jgi:hypothetical protein
MRIDQSTVSLSSAYSQKNTSEKHESLHLWDNRDKIELSGTGRVSIPSGNGNKSGNDAAEYRLSPTSRSYLLAQLIEKMTGRKVRILDHLPAASGQSPHAEARADSSEPAQNEGWGLRYTSSETYTEEERTVFRATGPVTANGKEIAFSASLTMERSFTQSQTLDIRAGDAVKDPLVVNLGAGPVALSAERIQFDIDADGTEDSMAFVSHESGFLAIDKSGNGIIDSGAELFGPATGNGFHELAAYDEDGNGWIDEGDSGYSAMRVWRQTDGQQTLETLESLGIGALYTKGTETPFELKDTGNTTGAFVRQSGIYLREDGSVGTIQKLDLVV